MSDDEVIVVADLEAGIGTLTRLEEGAVDVTIVVVEPTPRSLDVAQRAMAVAADRGQGRTVVVANKVESDADIVRVRAALGVDPVVCVPDDAAVVQADRAGTSIVDDAPPGPAVTALESLASLLV